MTFKFTLAQVVTTASGAPGTVVARTEFGDGRPHSYLVRFHAAPQRNDSFAEGELAAAEAEPEKAEQAVAAQPAAKKAPAKTTTKGKK
jgi:hypothetical protein